MTPERSPSPGFRIKVDNMPSTVDSF